MAMKVAINGFGRIGRLLYRAALETGTDIEFIRFQPFRIFGYRKHRKNDSYILLADVEKAAADSLYMPRYALISVVYDALLEGFNKKLFEGYVTNMRSEAVIRRAGYLLELLGEDLSLIHI